MSSRRTTEQTSRIGGSLLPAALPVLVLLLEPSHQRLEVLDDRAGIDVPRPGELLQRILPGLTRTKRQHRGVAVACFLAAEHRALVQRPLEAGSLAQRL